MDKCPPSPHRSHARPTLTCAFRLDLGRIRHMLLAGRLGVAAQQVDESDLFGMTAAHVEKSWRTDHDAHALSARYRYVEAVSLKEKFHGPRDVVAARCGHRIEHHRRLLPLEFVDRADLNAGMAGGLQKSGD